MNWYNINTQVGEDGEVDIFVFDEIGVYGISADKLINEVQALKPSTINLHINSPGGSITDGWAMFNYLRAHSATVNVYIDSMAASIAGVIAMAGDKIYMAEASLFHMHLPSVSGWIDANVKELEELAEALRKMDQILRNIYQKRTGASEEQLAEWFSKETYFTPEEALKEGLIDEVVDRVKMVACDATWKPDQYNSVHKAITSHNFESRHPNGAGGQKPQNNKPKPKENDMSETELNATIATLKAEAKLKDSEVQNLQAKVDQVPQLQADAKKEGATEALNAEKARRDGILAIRDKYNKDNDLDASATEALAGETTADEYKDQVLDLINKRPTTAPIQGGTGGKGADGEAKSEVEKLRAKLDKETDPVQRGIIAKQLRKARLGDDSE